MPKFFREITMALSMIVPLALGIWAMQNYVETRAKRTIINDNLDRIVLAAKAYLNENEYRQVSYLDLVEGKLLDDIKPIDGEDYKGLVLRRTGGILVVKMASGESVECKY